jgi:hypothetical protein
MLYIMGFVSQIASPLTDVVAFQVGRDVALPPDAPGLIAVELERLGIPSVEDSLRYCQRMNGG